MKNTFRIIALLALVAGFAFGQVTTTQTTLSAAVTANDEYVTLASATGVSAQGSLNQVNTILYIDREAMAVRSYSGTRVRVFRGQFGTAADTHAASAVVYLGPPNYFKNADPYGPCTSTLEAALPTISIPTGNLFRCTNSMWALQTTVTTVMASLGNNLELKTMADSKPVKINSRDYTQTSGTSMAFQSTPSQTVTTTGTITGGEIIPRAQDGVGIGDIIGLKVSAYLIGTSAGAVSGDMRGLQVELITTVGGTRTIAGDVTGIRIRSNVTSGTITGDVAAIRVLLPEGTKTYTHALKFDGAIPLVWNSAPSGEPSTADGYIAVMVNGAKRYIQLYSGAPTD